MAAISHINWIGFLALLGFLPCCIGALHFAARNVSNTLSGSFLRRMMLQTQAISFMLAAILFAAVGENWGGWDIDFLFKSVSSSPLKECRATDKNCNPYDAPENRAVLNNKNPPPKSISARSQVKFFNPYGNWREIAAPVDAITQKIFDAVDRGFIDVGEFEKLDFQNGNPNQGWRSKGLKAYKSSEQENYFLFPRDSIEGKNLEKSINALVGLPATSLKINLHREVDGDTISDSLVLVISDIREEVCSVHGGIKSMEIKIFNDNHQPVAESKSFTGCVRNTDGRVYLFVPFAGRIYTHGKWWLNRPGVF